MLVRELKVQYVSRPDIPLESPHLRTPREAAQFLLPLLENEAVEVCVLLCLSVKHRLLCFHELSRGTLDSTSVHPREVFKVALLANAGAVLVAHAHPSGDPTPSAEDVHLALRLVEAGKVIGVEVADFLITGHDGRYYSFKEGARI